MRDIDDGKMYQKFLKKLHEENEYNYASLIFNTDGALLFESSTYSIRPIFVMVNELPINIRTKELVLVLGPFVDRMNNLATKGVQCSINGEPINIKLYTQVCCVDSVARAPLQGFVQFNGCYGCNQCLHP